MNFKEYLKTTPEAQAKIEKLELQNQKYEREIQYFNLRLAEKHEFNEVPKFELLSIFITVIQMGATFDPLAKNIYFYPLYKHAVLQFTINFIIEKSMAMGILKQPPKIQAVKEKDVFTCNFSTGDFNHEMNGFDRGETVGVYCQIETIQGTKYIEVMDKEQIKTVASKTKTKDNKVYKDFADEMARKSVFYRLIKRMPVFTQNETLKKVLSIEDQLYEFKNEAKELPEKSSVNITAKY